MYQPALGSCMCDYAASVSVRGPQSRKIVHHGAATARQQPHLVQPEAARTRNSHPDAQAVDTRARHLHMHSDRPALPSPVNRHRRRRGPNARNRPARPVYVLAARSTQHSARLPGLAHGVSSVLEAGVTEQAAGVRCASVLFQAWGMKLYMYYACMHSYVLPGDTCAVLHGEVRMSPATPRNQDNQHLMCCTCVLHVERHVERIRGLASPRKTKNIHRKGHM